MIEPASALLLGIVGSLHCAGMCGPLALALPQTGGSSVAFLLGRCAYHAGRVATYCVLGALSGLVGRSLVLAGVQRWVSIGLGAALLLGLLSSRRITLLNPVVVLVSRLKTGMAALLRRRSILALAVLGLLNGLLPCGLVYVACAGAVATGGLLSGAAYMTSFGLGTLPMMLALSMSRTTLPPSWRLRFSKAIPAAIFLLAALLILRGMELGIPLLSPVLSNPASPSCHE